MNYRFGAAVQGSVAANRSQSMPREPGPTPGTENQSSGLVATDEYKVYVKEKEPMPFTSITMTADLSGLSMAGLNTSANAGPLRTPTDPSKKFVRPLPASQKAKERGPLTLPPTVATILEDIDPLASGDGPIIEVTRPVTPEPNVTVTTIINTSTPNQVDYDIPYTPPGLVSPWLHLPEDCTSEQMEAWITSHISDVHTVNHAVYASPEFAKWKARLASIPSRPQDGVQTRNTTKREASQSPAPPQQTTRPCQPTGRVNEGASTSSGAGGQPPRQPLRIKAAPDDTMYDPTGTEIHLACCKRFQTGLKAGAIRVVKKTSIPPDLRRMRVYMWRNCYVPNQAVNCTCRKYLVWKDEAVHKILRLVKNLSEDDAKVVRICTSNLNFETESPVSSPQPSPVLSRPPSKEIISKVKNALPKRVSVQDLPQCGRRASTWARSGTTSKPAFSDDSTDSSGDDTILGCDDGAHCVKADRTAKTEMCKLNVLQAQNIISSVTSTATNLPAVYTRGANGQIRVSTPFVADKASGEQIVYNPQMTFMGAMTVATLPEQFTLEFDDAVKIDQLTLAGDDVYMSDGNPDTKKLTAMLVNKRVVSEATARFWALQMPVDLSKFNNSGFYFSAYCMAHHVAMNEAVEGRPVLQVHPLVDNNFALRNMNGPNLEEFLQQSRNDWQARAIIVPGESLNSMDINVLRHIASGHPRYHQDGQQRRFVHERFRGLPIQIRVYDGHARPMPALVDLTAQQWKDSITKIGVLMNEEAEMVSGYMRMSLVVNGVTRRQDEAGENELNFWIMSTLELGPYRVPQPVGHHPIWVVLGLIRNFKDVMSGYLVLTESAQLRAMTSAQMPLVSATIAALFSTITSHVLYYHNVRREELNWLLYGDDLEIIAVLRTIMNAKEGAVANAWQGMICDQVARWTNLTINLFMIHTRNFCVPVEPPAGAADITRYMTLPAGCPRIGDLASCAVFMEDLPYEWGLFAKPVSWDLTAEVLCDRANQNDHGLYLRYGDPDYQKGADAGAKSYRMVGYGATALNAIRHEFATEFEMVLAFERIRRNLSASAAPFHAEVEADWQPNYVAESNIIEPGTLMTYDHVMQDVLAPAVLYPTFDNISWAQLTSRKVVASASNCGWFWPGIQRTRAGVNIDQSVEDMVPGFSEMNLNMTVIPPTSHPQHPAGNLHQVAALQHRPPQQPVVQQQNAVANPVVPLQQGQVNAEANAENGGGAP